MQRKRFIGLLAVAILIASCAASKVPPEFASLKQDVTLVELSGYQDVLRDGYKQAHANGQMPFETFKQAVLADRAMTIAWERYLDIRLAGGNDPAKWIAVVEGISDLERIIRQWVSIDLLNQKPAALIGGG